MHISCSTKARVIFCRVCMTSSYQYILYILYLVILFSYYRHIILVEINTLGQNMELISYWFLCNLQAIQKHLVKSRNYLMNNFLVALSSSTSYPFGLFSWLWLIPFRQSSHFFSSLGINCEFLEGKRLCT